MFLDAIGKACPMPVVMAKRELDGGCGDLTVAVDNETAVENLKRLAAGRGLQAAAEARDGVFHVRITGTAAAGAGEALSPCACGPQTGGYAVFIGKDRVGEGEGELGYNLLKMALYTLAQGDSVPAAVLFMNSGVKLPAGDEEQVLDSLRTLLDRGAEVLVCGTCLNFYGLTERLKVGTVSNMYDILGRMQAAQKVITL